MKKIETYLQEQKKIRPNLQKDLEQKNWILEIWYNISLLRQEKKISQKEFAEKLWITQWAVSRIESWQNMKCETLWKISDALWENISIFWANVVQEKKKVANYFLETKKENKLTSSSVTINTKQLWYNFNTIKSSFTFLTNNTYESATI